MSGSIRCRNCGGLNPPGAEWCGQCLQPFAARTPPPPPPPSGVGQTSAVAESTTPFIPQQPVVAQQPVVPQQRGAFTVTDTGITWKCSRCDTQNPLDASICSICGTTFADSMRPPEDKPQRDPNTVALYSLFFPGAGHWYMGLKGPAVARGVLSTWVVVVAVLAAVAGSLLMAVVFGLSAFALWAIAAHDAYRHATGAQQMVLLKSRTFVYVVLGLLMLMVVMLVSAGLRASS